MYLSICTDGIIPSQRDISESPVGSTQNEFAIHCVAIKIRRSTRGMLCSILPQAKDEDSTASTFDLC